MKNLMMFIENINYLKLIIESIQNWRIMENITMTASHTARITN